MYAIFKERCWFDRRYDGRRKEFRGISREVFERAKRPTGTGPVRGSIT